MSTSYSFHVSDDVWKSWKITVPAEQNLHDRVARLLVADIVGDATILEETPKLILSHYQE